MGLHASSGSHECSVAPSVGTASRRHEHDDPTDDHEVNGIPRGFVEVRVVPHDAKVERTGLLQGIAVSLPVRETVEDGGGQWKKDEGRVEACSVDPAQGQCPLSSENCESF